MLLRLSRRFERCLFQMNARVHYCPPAPDPFGAQMYEMHLWSYKCGLSHQNQTAPFHCSYPIRCHHDARRGRHCKLVICLTIVITLSMGFVRSIFTSISLACGVHLAVLRQVSRPITVMVLLGFREITSDVPYCSTIEALAFITLTLVVPITSGQYRLTPMFSSSWILFSNQVCHCLCVFLSAMRITFAITSSFSINPRSNARRWSASEIAWHAT